MTCKNDCLVNFSCGDAVFGSFCFGIVAAFRASYVLHQMIILLNIISCYTNLAILLFIYSLQ